MKNLWQRLASVSLGVKIVGFSLFVLIAVLIVVSYNAIKIVKNQETLLIQSEEKELKQLQKEIDTLAKQYLATALAIADQEITKEALRTQNRELLIPHAQRLLQKINQNVPEKLKIHYHVPPGFSFLRVWKPQKFGDDLRSFRHTVVKVQQSGKPIAGIEAGRAGLAIRGIAPVIGDSGEILGSVEVFSSINAHAKKVARPGQKDVAILRKETVKTFQNDGSIHVGNFRLIYATQKDLFKPVLSEDFIHSAERGIHFLRQNHVLFLGAPIRDYSGKVTGVWLSAINLAAFEKAQKDLIFKNILYTAILALIAGILIYLHTKKHILNPLKACLLAVERVAEGDLNAKVDVKNLDEIGKLAQGINHMTHNLRKLVRKVNEGVENIETTENKLLETSGSLIEISKEAQNKIEFLANSSQLNQERITQLASANEEITVTVQNVSQNVGDTVNMLQQVTEQVENTIGVISQLNQHFAKIEEVVAFISQIADQTNLLALNATIEAARAGEAGKGFAVVANEVKELARQTAEATDKIVNTIQNLRHLVEGSVEAVYKVDELVNPVREMAENMAVAMEQTAHAAQEISQQSQEVLNNTESCFCHLEEIKRIIEDVRRAAELSDDTAQKLRKLSVALHETIAKFKL